MRLFIAIDLSDEIKRYLRGLQALLPNAQMNKTADFHLTLKFLGECDDEKKKNIESSLREIHFKPFSASLDQIGVFGGAHPHVIWVGLKAPSALFELVKLIEEKLFPLGFKSENCFEPHLTLARVKFVKNSADFLVKLKNIQVEPEIIKADHFVLFKSELTSRGAIYSKLAQFPC